MTEPTRRSFLGLLGLGSAALCVPELFVPTKTYFFPLARPTQSVAEAFTDFFLSCEPTFIQAREELFAQMRQQEYRLARFLKAGPQ